MGENLEIAKLYRTENAKKPLAEQIAYQEGVTAAAFTLAAWIDTLPDDIHPGWHSKLDDFFWRLQRVKLETPLNPADNLPCATLERTTDAG